MLQYTQQLSYTICSNDTLAEWLRRRPAKPMGSPRVGSNPTGVEPFLNTNRPRIVTMFKHKQAAKRLDMGMQRFVCCHRLVRRVLHSQVAVVKVQARTLQRQQTTAYLSACPYHYARSSRSMRPAICAHSNQFRDPVPGALSPITTFIGESAPGPK